MEGDISNNRLAQYWTAEQDTGKSSFICQFGNSSWDLASVSKWFGLPIRPVYTPLIKINPELIRSIKDSATKAIKKLKEEIYGQASRDCSENITGIHNRKYPAKTEINEYNIFNILIKDCIPYGKSVFEGDKVKDLNLDLNKLNQILEENYSLKPLPFITIASMRLQDLKAYLLYRLSK